MATGRPTKLTKEMQDKITQLIAAGNYPDVACEIAGLGRSTYYSYLNLGKEQKKGKYRDFLDAIKRAEAMAEAKRVQTIIKASDMDWKAAAWYLERKYNERWGKKEKIEHSGNIDGNHSVNLTTLSSAELEEEIKKLREQE